MSKEQAIDRYYRRRMIWLLEEWKKPPMKRLMDRSVRNEELMILYTELMERTRR